MLLNGSLEADNTLVFNASFRDPVTKELQEHRITQQLISGDRILMRYFIWSPGANESVLAMENRYEQSQ